MRGVHTCTSYVAKKVLCYKMIHVSLLGGSTELEQVAVWSLLAFLVLIAGFLLYSYVRLHVRLSRNVQNRRTSEEDEAIELQIRDLKSRVIELESDYQVSAKK